MCSLLLLLRASRESLCPSKTKLSSMTQTGIIRPSIAWISYGLSHCNRPFCVLGSEWNWVWGFKSCVGVLGFIFSFLPHVIHPHQIPAVISLGLSMLHLLRQSRSVETVRVTECLHKWGNGNEWGQYSGLSDESDRLGLKDKGFFVRCLL